MSYSHSQAVIQADRQDDCDNSSNPTSASPLSQPPTTKEQGLPKISIVRDVPHTQSGSQRGIELVDQRSNQMEWETDYPTAPPPPPQMEIETDASLLGWGARLGGQTTGGMWSVMEREAHINHQCIGTLRWNVCSEGSGRE